LSANTSNIQAYIKDSIGLVLEIKDMLEEEINFHFMNGLQPWVQSELQWKNMQTLAATITAMEKLLEFWSEPKIGPRKSEHTQGENQKQGNWKRKDKGNTKTSKDNKDNATQTNTTKEKNPILC